MGKFDKPVERIPPVSRSAAILVAAASIYAGRMRDGIPTKSKAEALAEALELTRLVESSLEAR